MSREFRFVRAGHKQAVLLMHGLTGSPSELVYMGRALFKAGYDVHCPVLPGHSAGLLEVKATTWMDWYNFALQEFDELARRYEVVFVSGLCLGATLALAVAEVRPNVQAVAALAPLMKMDGWSIPRLAFLLPFVLYTPLKFFFIYLEVGSLGVKNERAREMMKAAFSKGDDSLDCFPMICILEMLRFSKFLKARLGNISAPLALFHSEEDDFADIGNAEMVYARVRSSKKAFHRLKNSYHLLAIDNDKEYVAQQTIDFFRSVMAGGV